MNTEEPSVLLSTQGRIGRIVLNRPRALNALDHGMLREIAAALDTWESDDAVAAVLLTGAGERGLCAGADIRAIRAAALGDGRQARAFFRDEYRLNARIARYPKSYVAIMDGITMGGGVGVSAHGSVRIVTERSQVAMPETRIGLVPDVGGSRLFALAPGELGTHLALTSASMTAGDALHCGFADHFVPSERLPELLAALTHRTPEEAVRAYAAPAPASELAAQREWIDACYRAETVEEIIDRLLATGLPAAKETAEQILGKSPTAVKVTLRALRLARGLDSLEETLRQEYRISCTALASPDLVEGIRAQVIDKDRNPRWSPASLAEVTEAAVERYFAPLPADDPGLG